MDIRDVYRYAWFADLAYVRWSEADRVAPNPADTSSAALIAAANAAERIPGDADSPGVDNLGDRIFMTPGDGGLGWKLLAFHANADTDSGFAGSVFGNAATGEKVLALRGTEPSFVTPALDDLLNSDLRDIVGFGVAVEQAVALVNWVNRLRAPAGADVAQLALPPDAALAALRAQPLARERRLDDAGMGATLSGRGGIRPARRESVDAQRAPEGHVLGNAARVGAVRPCARVRCGAAGMLGLTVFLLLALYIGLGAALAHYTGLWAKRRGRSAARWGSVVAVVWFAPVFGNLAASFVIKQVYCALDGGFEVVKPLEQWVAEHPGVAATLEPMAGTRSERVDGWDRYRLNQRLAWEVRTIPVVLLVLREDERFVDVATGEVLATYTNYQARGLAFESWRHCGGLKASGKQGPLERRNFWDLIEHVREEVLHGSETMVRGGAAR